MVSQIKDGSHLLHDLRSAHLRRMPRVSGTMLSAGCAGLWYFNWIAERTKHTGRHIGIEFYSAKPDGLPANVEWIANTVGDMSDVASSSCELVFSGENLEHLWPEDVVGFFLESWRVLAQDGWLVVDSPNRLVTEDLCWSHPEHTVELTPAEAVELATLSGFKVEKMVGLWLCRDPDTGRLLDFESNVPDQEWPLLERVLAAEQHPDHSFLWWLEARKAGTPQPDALASAMKRIFAQAWPERALRFVSGAGVRTVTEQGTIIRCEPDQTGPMLYGPYMPLQRGRYAAEFTVVAHQLDRSEKPVVRCDVVGADGREIIVRFYSTRVLQKLNGVVRLEFELEALEFGIQARCFALGGATVECRYPAAIRARD